MEFQTQPGSFTTVNGIRYTFVGAGPESWRKAHYDGGAAGGRLYPAQQYDERGHNSYKHPKGFVVFGPGIGSGRSFPTLIAAADFAQKRQRKIYEAHKAFVAAFDAQIDPPIDREAFNAFWSQNQTLGFKEAREQFRALVKEGVING